MEQRLCASSAARHQRVQRRADARYQAVRGRVWVRRPPQLNSGTRWRSGAGWHLEQRQVAEDLDVIAVMLERIHVAFDRLIVVPLRPVQQPEHAKE